MGWDCRQVCHHPVHDCSSKYLFWCQAVRKSWSTNKKEVLIVLRVSNWPVHEIQLLSQHEGPFAWFVLHSQFPHPVSIYLMNSRVELLTCLLIRISNRFPFMNNILMGHMIFLVVVALASETSFLSAIWYYMASNESSKNNILLHLQTQHWQLSYTLI